ncbi:MAG: M15 family metallopeptidase [Ruminococcus sp.]|nr:M15 family metallopeptidase [Ruminococcus sp.]
MPKKKITKEKSINRTKTSVELTICLIALGTAGYVGYSCWKHAQIVPETSDMASDVSEIEIPDTSDVLDPNKIIFTSAVVDTRSKFDGELILVNNDHEYYENENADLVSIMEMNDETDRHMFTAVDYTYKIRRSVYEPMAQMIEDFYEKYYNDTLIIYGSYRTKDFQEELYNNFINSSNDDSEEAPIVAPAGFSEHETGYAFDFSETVNYDYQGDGDFQWLNENCYKYGFIIRYTEDKKDITKYRSEPWHFRYVGVPHATYMTKQNICFEEYIDLLKNNYEYSGEHLFVTDDDGKNYEIFYYASDDGSDVTSVPVPSGYKYDISGNNVDGFIVTVHTDEKVPFGQENPDSATTEPESETADEQEY